MLSEPKLLSTLHSLPTLTVALAPTQPSVVGGGTSEKSAHRSAHGRNEKPRTAQKQTCAIRKMPFTTKDGIEKEVNCRVKNTGRHRWTADAGAGQKTGGSERNPGNQEAPEACLVTHEKELHAGEPERLCRNFGLDTSQHLSKKKWRSREAPCLWKRTGRQGIERTARLARSYGEEEAENIHRGTGT